MKPQVSLCMIVRDEESNLPDCLAGVRDLVDEIIIVDTGSHDRTKEVAAQFGARVFDYAWSDDFAAARNETLKHATGDWIFWMDADDRLDAENRQRLAALLAGLKSERTIYTMQCRSALNSTLQRACWVSHCRLFPRHEALRWRYRVHEQVMPEGDARFATQWTDIIIDHIGYTDPVRRRQKLHRDLRLLQMEFALHPDDALTLFYLGWTYTELRNYPNALRFLQRSLGRNPRNRKAYVLQAQAFAAVGRAEEALQACTAGLSLFADDPELLFQKGRLLGEAGDLAGAEWHFLKLLETQHRPYFEVGTDDGFRSERSRFLLGLIYQEQGRFTEAETHLKAALAENPQFLQAWLGLGQMYLQLGWGNPLADVLDRLARCPGGLVLAMVLRARVHIVREEFDAAQGLLEQAIAQEPELVWARLVYCDLLTARGAPLADQYRAQQEVLALDPNQPLARQRLEQLQQEINRQREAVPPREAVAAVRHAQPATQEAEESFSDVTQQFEEAVPGCCVVMAGI